MSCPDADTLAAIASLPDEDRAAIADHAATCADCRQLMLDLLAVVETARTEGPVESPRSADPATIDRYRIERRIGAGAMGVVYAAYDPELARPVAVKVLRAGGSPERMKREAQALARLTHPNVVAVHDVGEHRGHTFVTMALVDGSNLRTWLQQVRPTAQIIDAITQAVRGVDAAHRAGIVHRDLKPDNIFVARTGEVLVGDFGLARSSSEVEAGGDRDAGSGDLTQTGSVIGTPAYMAPEQLDGDASTASDQFALCVTAWEALYGTRPFSGKTFGELATAVAAGPPEEPDERSVPAHVRAAIRRGLAADPEARHPSTAALLAALAPKRRRRWPYVVLAAGLGAAAVTGVVALRGDDDQVAAAIARCEQLPGPAAWATERRDQTLARMAAPGVKPAIGRVVGSVVDRYASDWTTLRRESCIASARRAMSEPVLAATTRCLDRRAATLDWLVKDTKFPPLEKMGLLEVLEPIETCRSVAADTAPSAELAALQNQLDQATVLLRRVVVEHDVVAVFLSHAQRLGDQGIIAEASHLFAVALHKVGHAAEAELNQAIRDAEQARDDRIRTRSSAVLAVVSARAGRVTEAATQRDLATSALVRSSDPFTAMAIEQANVAIAYARQDLPAEIAALRRIEAIERARLGEPSWSLAEARIALAGALQRSGAADASTVLDSALAMIALFSDRTTLLDLEQAALRERSPAARIALGERAIAIARRDEPARVPGMLSTIGFDYEGIGNYEKALATALEALRLTTEPALRAQLLETAATMSYELADLATDKATRARRLDQALGYLDQLPTNARESESVQTIRGRVLLLHGRYAEALPLLTASLGAAENADPPHPYRVAVRSFALAQTLWEVGSDRDRDRARALAATATARFPDARAMFLADPNYGAALDRLDRQVAQLATWRRRHP